MIDFQKNIFVYRENNFLTQNDLAQILNVSETTVNRWEKGKFNPSMKYRKKLYKLFVESGIIRGKNEKQL